MLTGFLQGDWTLLLLSQSLLFVIIIYHFLKIVGPASVSFCCFWHYNLKWPRHGSRDRWGVGAVGLKQTHTSALKLSMILQSENCMRGIYTTQVPSTHACTGQLMFCLKNTLLFYHIWVSSKWRSLRPFCGAHLGLLWDNNDTYWMTNVPHN